MAFIGIEESKRRLQALQKPGRFTHSLQVMETAVNLCRRYGGREDVVRAAGLLHDCCKHEEAVYLPRYKEELAPFISYPSVLHAPMGALMARDVYGVSSLPVRNAISYHCTGRPGMTNEEAVVFLADGIEPGRDYPGIAGIREASDNSLNRAVALLLESTLEDLLQKRANIFPLTLEALAYYKNRL